jgi:hypothetical protein
MADKLSKKLPLSIGGLPNSGITPLTYIMLNRNWKMDEIIGKSTKNQDNNKSKALLIPNRRGNRHLVFE